MKMAIIGGGITGLSAAYSLSKTGHSVTVFEKEPVLGGLASGFKEKNWDWPLEKTYHHLFANDTSAFRLLAELGLSDKLITKRPITANLVHLPGAKAHLEGGRTDSFRVSSEKRAGRHAFSPPCHGLGWTKLMEQKTIWTLTGRESRHADLSARLLAASGGTMEASNIFPFDSPLHLLRFTPLPLIDRLRTGMLAAYCKISPFWKPLEQCTAEQFIKRIAGEKSWQTLWYPLLYGKFGDLANTVSASWFWARVKKRTPKLCYMEGGFQTLIEALAQAIGKHGGKILLKTNVSMCQRVNVSKQKKQRYQITIKQYNNKTIVDLFDSVLFTIPTSVAINIVPDFAFSIGHLALDIPHLHAQTLILETKEPILKNVYPDKIGAYWLNILDRSFPFLAVVAHTNFVDKKYYGGRHLTYFGNYLPDGHPYLSMTKDQLLKKFIPYIKRLMGSKASSGKQESVKRKNALRFTLYASYLFTDFYAQPVHQLHYSGKIPPITTVPGIFLANMDFIVPWDRGINYAVELGQRAATEIMKASGG